MYIQRVGIFTVTVIVSNNDNVVTDSVSITVPTNDHCYVSQEGSHMYPYLTWETAASNIQVAVDVAPSNGFVIVTNGVYSSGAQKLPFLIDEINGYEYTRVWVQKPLEIRSVNGPEQTQIGTTNGSFTRGIWLCDGAELHGVTVEGRMVRNYTFEGGYGGGIYCESNAVISNCIIRNSTAVGGRRSFLGGQSLIL